MPCISRRIRVIGRGNGVRVSNPAIGPVDHGLAASRAAEDLLGPSLSFGLGVEVATGALSAGCLDIPAAAGVRDDVSFVSSRHKVSLVI
jgi:hypothetical protein